MRVHRHAHTRGRHLELEFMWLSRHSLEHGNMEVLWETLLHHGNKLWGGVRQKPEPVGSKVGTQMGWWCRKEAESQICLDLQVASVRGVS